MIWTGRVLAALALVATVSAFAQAQTAPEPAAEAAPAVVEAQAPGADAAPEPDVVSGTETAPPPEPVEAAPAVVEAPAAVPEPQEAAPVVVEVPAPEPAEAAPAVVEAPAPAVGGESDATGVARAVFASGIADREPVNPLDAVPAGLETLVFFTALEGLEGRRVEHRWAPVGERPGFGIGFAVGGATWRVWSQRPIAVSDTGPWQVDVLVDGQLLERYAIGR